LARRATPVRKQLQGHRPLENVQGPRISLSHRLSRPSRNLQIPRPPFPETEKIKEDYASSRARLRQRLGKLQTRLKSMAPVNRALRLNRVPAIETRILSALDREGLLGKQIFVVGTNALFA
jgi:hypothetical protein